LRQTLLSAIMFVTAVGCLSPSHESAVLLSNLSHVHMTALWVADAIILDDMDTYVHHLCGCVAIQCTLFFQWEYPRLACMHLIVLELPVMCRNAFTILLSRAIVNPLISLFATHFLWTHQLWVHLSCYLSMTVLYVTWAVGVFKDVRSSSSRNNVQLL
jgi:hypothetical protein